MTNTNRTLLLLRAAIVEDMKLNPGLIVEAERDRFLNRALLDLSDTQLFEKTITIAYTSGVITLPDDFMSLTYLKRTDGVLLKALPRPSALLTGSSPVGYIQEAGTIELVPTPDTGSTLSMCYVYRLAPLVNATDQPGLPNGYDDLLIDFAVALCHRKNGNMGIYREYMGMYNVGKASLMTELTNKINSKITSIQDTSNVLRPWTPFDSIY